MVKRKKQTRLKRAGKIIVVIKKAIRKTKTERKQKKATRQAARKENLMKLQGHVKNFMEAAFEPKTIKTERKRKRKLEKQSAK